MKSVDRGKTKGANLKSGGGNRCSPTATSPNRRYHRVGKGPYVDESLFQGTAKEENGLVVHQNVSRTTPTNVAVISRGELDSMRRHAVTNDEQNKRAEQERITKLNELKSTSELRKQRMINLDEEATHKVKRSEIELENMARDTLIKQMAAEKLDENNDLVKLFKSMGASAAAFTVRDQQLKEKEECKALEKEYNQRLDMQMELELLKDVQARNKIEEEKLSKRKEGLHVIMEQIKERERGKLLQLEARARENEEMLSAIKKYEEEEAELEKARQEGAQKARLEILAENEKAIAHRKALKQIEKERDDAILEFQLQKDAELKQRKMDEEERKLQFKERQERLLDGQKQILDKRSQHDELVMKRAAEEKERAQRKLDLENAAKKKNYIKWLQEDMKAQANIKKAKEAEEKERDQAEFEASLRYNSLALEREQREVNAKHEAAQKHLSALVTQIKQVESKSKAEQRAKFEEGNRFGRDFAREKTKLECSRSKIMNELHQKGVNPKYLAEMNSVDVSKLMGLPTPRGSGTSGYVQSNRGHISSQRARERASLNAGRDVGGWGGGGSFNDSREKKMGQKPPNKDIMEHETKRRLEAKLYELQEELEEEGKTKEEIDKELDKLRTKLQSSMMSSMEPPKSKYGQRRGDGPQSGGSHRSKLLKDSENERMKNAFGMGEHYSEGEAFDEDFGERERARRKAEYEQRRIEKEEREREQRDRSLRRREERVKEREVRIRELEEREKKRARYSKDAGGNTSPDREKSVPRSRSPERRRRIGENGRSDTEIGVRKHRSRSPRGRRDRSHTPSPRGRGNSSHSPSSRGRRDRSHSPSPRGRRNSSHSPSSRGRRDRSNSPSPRGRRNSSHSPSSRGRRDRSHAPSPRGCGNSSHSSSPRGRRNSSHSPSPSGRRDRSHSPSPSGQRNNSHSPSPRGHQNSTHSPSPPEHRRYNKGDGENTPPDRKKLVPRSRRPGRRRQVVGEDGGRRSGTETGVRRSRSRSYSGSRSPRGRSYRRYSCSRPPRGCSYRRYSRSRSPRGRGYRHYTRSPSPHGRRRYTSYSRLPPRHRYRSYSRSPALNRRRNRYYPRTHSPPQSRNKDSKRPPSPTRQHCRSPSSSSRSSRSSSRSSSSPSRKSSSSSSRSRSSVSRSSRDSS